MLPSRVEVVNFNYDVKRSSVRSMKAASSLGVDVEGNKSYIERGESNETLYYKRKALE